MGGILDYTLKPYLQRQLNARQGIVAQKQRDTLFLQYTTAKNSWCRMTSFVNYDPEDGSYKGDQLSRKYVLEGGTLYPNPNKPDQYALRRGVSNKAGSYGSLGDGLYGIRPMPGITSIDIKNRSSLGSTREATVKFMCWDKGQLEELEILFHRPGYSVLIEFGWSVYLDTHYSDSGSSSSKVVDSIPLSQVKMKNFNDPTINAFDSTLTPPILYDKFEALRHKFSGNYDAMYGLIRNFSFVELENGGFECTTEVISAADVLDSLKINSSTYPLNNSNQDNTSKSKRRLLTRFEQIFLPIIDYADPGQQVDYLMNNIIGSNLSLYQKDPSKGKYDPNIDFSIYAIPFKSVPSTLLSDARKNLGGSLHYISLAGFIAIMHLQFGIYDPRGQNNNVPLVSLETPYPGYGSYGNGLCLCSEDTISIDPTICLINNPNAKFVVDGVNGFVPNVSSKNKVAVNMNPFSYNGAKNVGIIGNIYICIEFIVDKFRNLANDQDTVDMNKFISSLLKDISYSLGSVNQFGIFANDSTIAIIDAHFVEDPSIVMNNRFTFNYFGTNSIVRGFNIVSKIFPNQATMVAIGAGVRANIAAVQTSTYNLMNKGLTDRTVIQKLDADAITSLTNTNGSGSNTQEQQDNAYRQQLAQMVLDLRTYVQSYLQKSDLSQIFIQKQAANSNLNSVIVKVNSDTNFKALIPISLQLTVDGIGGIVIGNVFKLNPDTLPKDYVSKNVAFRIVDLIHNIKDSDWTTTITAQCCLLGGDEKQELSALNKVSINAAITGIQQAQQQQVQNDLQKQIYIYNNLVKLIVALFGPNNASALSNVNQYISSTNMFQPGSTPVQSFTFTFNVTSQAQKTSFGNIVSLATEGPLNFLRNTDFNSPGITYLIQSTSFPGYPTDVVKQNLFSRDVSDFVTDVKITNQNETGNVVSVTGKQYILNPYSDEYLQAAACVNNFVKSYPDYGALTQPLLKQNILQALVDISNGFTFSDKGIVTIPLMYILQGQSNPTIMYNVNLNVRISDTTNF